MPVKQKGTIYLTKDRFQLYIQGMTSIVECPFPLDVIRDLDLVNQEKFANTIKIFLTNYKIPPGNIIIVIADSISFIKDFLQSAQPPLIPLEQLEKQAKEYPGLVPFEEILSKTISLKNGYRVIVANKELLDALQRALEANQFEISAILPAIIFGQEVSGRPIMDATVASAILRKTDSLIKDYNLLNQPTINLELEKEQEIEIPDETGTPEKPKNNLPLLSGVFGFLIIVLAVVAWTQLKPQKAPVSSNTSPTPQNQSTIIPSIILSPAATVTNIESVTIQIISKTQTTEKAAELKQDLEKIGFKNISVTIQPNLAASNTTITFSPTTNQTTRTSIINEVQKVALSTNIQEKSDTTTDITILLVN